MKRRISRERSDSYLRLWLRLLKCTMLIETRVRIGLREGFSSTLPRFDMLAQLDSAGDDGLTMGELSKRLMVTNGNLTGLTERLVKERLVTRTPQPHDRRSQKVSLTASGRRAWDKMAASHRGWIENMFTELNDAEVKQLYRLTGRLKASVQESAREQLRERE
jgi:DNA-binding MarR family transcriptional regulator